MVVLLCCMTSPASPKQRRIPLVAVLLSRRSCILRCPRQVCRFQFLQDLRHRVCRSICHGLSPDSIEHRAPIDFPLIAEGPVGADLPQSFWPLLNVVNQMVAVLHIDSTAHGNDRLMCLSEHTFDIMSQRQIQCMAADRPHLDSVAATSTTVTGLDVRQGDGATSLS